MVGFPESRQGSRGTAAPDLACVVMSLGNPRHLVAAVRSLVEQDEAVEIVVVNTGGGDPARRLRAAGIDVPVVTRREVLYPGGARNLGIEATTAPYVSFLASDCVAEPGWARGRLHAHRAGAAFVSAAMTNYHAYSLSAVAAHVLLFPNRLPNTPPHRWLHYSASYDRALFDRYGPFREDLRTGEDTEFRERLGPEVVPHAAREVRAAHRNARWLPALLKEQFERGGRTVRAYRSLWGEAGARHARAELRRAFKRNLRWVWRATSRKRRLPLVLSVPHTFLGVLAARAGAWAASSDRSPSAAARPPRLYALLVFRNEMRYLPGYVANVRPHVDGILALDDGSTDGSAEFLERQPGVLEVVRRPAREPHVWDEPGSRRLLLEAAARHGPEWLVALDADERVERHFRTRVLSAIGLAERRGVKALAVKLRELWDAADTWRADGIWGTKTRGRLFRWRPDHLVDPRAFHGTWTPVNGAQDGGCPLVDAVIYHLKMIRAEDREARRRKNEELDPGNRWQAIGYSYLTDPTGLELEPLPRGRDYVPLAGPPSSSVAGGPGAPSA
jgi:glycosyltransferase involved in cell wall biosynthesis